jgi:hypothetical protein
MEGMEPRKISTSKKPNLSMLPKISKYSKKNIYGCGLLL